ncbi:MAG TPA: response regulator transcription factor [Armatimonadota bacterium]|jgi:DNA-binding NarL/FixJ family response regulator
MLIRVLLVDDHRLMREGLRSLLETQDDVKVIGQADNGRTAVQLARELHPTVVIMDVTMPELNGIEATRQILQESPDTKVIALTMHSDPRYVAEMLKAGALGYVLKDSVFEELRLALQQVITNQPYFSARIASIVLEGYLCNQSSQTHPPVYRLLTAREREVLQLLAEGKATKEIALTLTVSTKTVEKHRQQIMEKLELHSVAELTRYAIREGLVPLDN